MHRLSSFLDVKAFRYIALRRVIEWYALLFCISKNYIRFKPIAILIISALLNTDFRRIAEMKTAFLIDLTFDDRDGLREDCILLLNLRQIVDIIK